MSTQITAPAEQDTRQRDGFMAALAAAEQFISTSPVLPSSMDIRCYPWDCTPEISPYFHGRAEAVREFAAFFGAEVSERIHDDGRVNTEAVGRVNGVAFRAWSLTEAPVEPKPLVISDDTIRQADALLQLNVADREAAEGGAA